MRILTAVLLACSVAGGASARDVVAEDSAGITRAVMRGEGPTLQRVGKSAVVAKLAARAGYHRVRGELAESSRWADLCIADSAVQAENSQGAMYLCRSLRAGNRLIEGGISAWAREMLQVRALYQEKIAPLLPVGDEVQAVTAPSFERFQNWPESGTLQGAVAAGTRLAVSDQAGVPVIRGKLSGGADGRQRDIDSDFVIDTGATRSHISRKAAAAMGLQVTEGFALDTSDPQRPLAIGLAAPLDLMLGGIRLRNVSFSVTDTVEFNIIGLDLLYRLGPLVLGRDRLELLGTLPAATCWQPLVTTSVLSGGQYSLRLPMRIGKRTEPVLLDTGADMVLRASGVDLRAYPPQHVREARRWTMHGQQSIRYAEATSPVTFSGITATLPVQLSDQPAMVYPVSWQLGFGLRGDYDYYLDVAGGRGCLAPAKATAAAMN